MVSELPGGQFQLVVGCRFDSQIMESESLD
jgi:hypothetical protein